MTADSTEIFAKLSELLTPFNTKNIELKPDTEIFCRPEHRLGFSDGLRDGGRRSFRYRHPTQRIG